jgi:membrane associated rhomboid family serine protease
MMRAAMESADVGYCYRHPDRETALACSQCGRFICPECMRPTPTGQRCPECVGKTRVIRPRVVAGVAPYVTYALIAINALVFLADQQGVFNSNRFDLWAPALANGEWYRLLTSMFLHANIAHIGLNMLSLYWIGPMVEARYGHVRYLALYIASGIVGGAGAMLLEPHFSVVGASGAIFGLLGAIGMILLRTTGSIAPIMPVLVLNLLFTFTSSGISKGGHLGGLVGGVAIAYAYEALESRRKGVGMAVAAAAGIAVAAAVVAIAAASRVA